MLRVGVTCFRWIRGDYFWGTRLYFPVGGKECQLCACVVNGLTTVIGVGVGVSPCEFTIDGNVVLGGIVRRGFRAVPGAVVYIPVVIVMFYPVGADGLSFVFFSGPVAR